MIYPKYDGCSAQGRRERGKEVGQRKRDRNFFPIDPLIATVNEAIGHLSVLPAVFSRR